MTNRRENFTSIHFHHYPPLIVTHDRLDRSPIPISDPELAYYYTLTRKAFTPLLKHMTTPAHVTEILTSFSPQGVEDPTGKYRTMTLLVTKITTIFPELIFPRISDLINVTRELTDESVKRRNLWLRGKVTKDLGKARERVERLREMIVRRIVESEMAERHRELLMMDWVLGNLLEWRGGRSIMALEERLVTERA
ncbi:hypothetical protein C7212DRAFT_346547 [Tuber magnatum]|uniref:Uncharacterized protein n=1 Tax=Tuber magnatum TaxID=42249 RepID=A0A317SHN3_9PEZI|nr:hypothetical protein C7212DRAFT_346547 [Tuber magnatum]